MSLVLVVDDDTGARQAMEDILTDEGLTVMLAENGRRAIEHLANDRPTVVVTDLEMPDIDGEGLIAHTRQHHPDIPILVITSRLVLDAQREIERLGVFGYLNKPIDLDVLVEQIQSAVTTQPSAG